MDVAFKNTKIGFLFVFSLLLLLLLLSGCSKVYVTHGYSFRDFQNYDSVLSGVRVGSTNELEVLQVFGSPGFMSSFGTRTFFYVSNKVEHKPILKPAVIEQYILAISFDAQHIVTQVKIYNLGDAKNIEYCPYETGIKGNKLGIMEQFTKNIGRFGKPKKGGM
ncbi:putative SmpA / OmlA family protein [Alphaproteobacteria bacterium]